MFQLSFPYASPRSIVQDAMLDVQRQRVSAERRKGKKEETRHQQTESRHPTSRTAAPVPCNPAKASPKHCIAKAPTPDGACPEWKFNPGRRNFVISPKTWIVKSPEIPMALLHALTSMPRTDRDTKRGRKIKRIKPKWTLRFSALLLTAKTGKCRITSRTLRRVFVSTSVRGTRLAKGELKDPPTVTSATQRPAHHS